MPQGLPLSKKSSPPPGRGRRQTSEPSCRRGPANKACFQGCLLVFLSPEEGVPSGKSTVLVSKGIISTGARGAGLGLEALWLLDGSSWAWILNSQRKPRKRCGIKLAEGGWAQITHLKYANLLFPFPTGPQDLLKISRKSPGSLKNYQEDLCLDLNI